jgi:hypothetical protein
MRLSGLVSHAHWRTFVSSRSGISRGDRNRNARLARLRALVPPTNAIVGIDLADAKQMVVVTDHDSKVLARKTFRCRAGRWVRRWTGRGQATAKGWAGVTVSCRHSPDRPQRRSAGYGGHGGRRTPRSQRRGCRGHDDGAGRGGGAVTGTGAMVRSAPR